MLAPHQLCPWPQLPPALRAWIRCTALSYSFSATRPAPPQESLPSNVLESSLIPPSPPPPHLLQLSPGRQPQDPASQCLPGSSSLKTNLIMLPSRLQAALQARGLGVRSKLPSLCRTPHSFWNMQVFPHTRGSTPSPASPWLPEAWVEGSSALVLPELFFFASSPVSPPQNALSCRSQNPLSSQDLAHPDPSAWGSLLSVFAWQAPAELSTKLPLLNSTHTVRCYTPGWALVYSSVRWENIVYVALRVVGGIMQNNPCEELSTEAGHSEPTPTIPCWPLLFPPLSASVLPPP